MNQATWALALLACTLPCTAQDAGVARAFQPPKPPHIQFLRISRWPDWEVGAILAQPNGWRGAFHHSTGRVSPRLASLHVSEVDMSDAASWTDEARTQKIASALQECAGYFGNDREVITSAPLDCPVDGYAGQCMLHKGKHMGVPAHKICFAWMSKDGRLVSGSVFSGSTRQEAVVRDGLAAVVHALGPGAPDSESDSLPALPAF